MLVNCEYCKEDFEYNQIVPTAMKRFCDKCIQLRRELYPYKGTLKRTFVSRKNRKIIDIEKELGNRKKVFSWDKVSILC